MLFESCSVNEAEEKSGPVVVACIPVFNSVGGKSPFFTVLGIPSIICLFGGAFFGVWMLQLYAIEHQIVTNIALASIAFVLIGFFMLSTAITLYAISRLSKKMSGKR